MSPPPEPAADQVQARVVAGMAEGVIVYDGTGRALLANQRARDLLGLSEEQIRGEAPLQPGWGAMRADGTPWPVDELPVARVHATGVEVSDALMGIRRGDGIVWLSGNAVPVELEPGCNGVIATFRDATEVKLGRDVDQALRELATQLVVTPIGDAYMDDLLATLGRVADAERVLHVAIDRERGRARTSHQWSRRDDPIEPRPDGVPLDLLPRLLGGLARREVVTLTDRKDLPGDAVLLASQLTSWGLQSAIAVPVIADDALHGFITIGWTLPSAPHPRLVDFVVMGAELLSSRLDRERAHAELTQVNATLDDRVRERSEALVRERTQLAHANEELQRAMQARTNFLAGISHELRTPMAAILGHTEMLLVDATGVLDEAQLDSLRTIDASGRHLLALINDLIDLNHLDGRHDALDVEDVDLVELVRLAVDLVRPTAMTRGLTLDLVLDDVGDGGAAKVAFVRGDRKRLTQVLLNLLDNALKFTEVGGVSVRVRGPVAGEVSIEIADTGIGIATEHQARVQEAFFQVDSGTAKRFGGSGLGLAVVWKLVELHHGRIVLTSAVGAGATFEVVLPQAGPEAPVPAGTPGAADRYYHLVRRGDWDASIDAGEHHPPSLDDVGFVHLSLGTQVPATVARHYAGVDDLLVVEIDAGRLRAPVVFEEGEPGERFPHLYGPLALDAVIDVRPWATSPRGRA